MKTWLLAAVCLTLSFAAPVQAADLSDYKEVKDLSEKKGSDYLELYNQDDFRIMAVGFAEKDPGSNCAVLTLQIQNMTDEDVILSDAASFSYVNGSILSLGSYFEIASGETCTGNLYIDSGSLLMAGITKINQISLYFDVYDRETYVKLSKIGPLDVSIVGTDKLSNIKVYSDTETVREVQSRLKDAGYDCGAVDGVAGNKTKEMIVKYERDHDLQEIEAITDELLDALRTADHPKQKDNDKSKTTK